MSKSANMNIRIDPQVKAEVEAIYARYGLNLTDAINVFLYQSRNVNGLPFDLRPEKPNAETLTALKEIESMIKGKSAKKAQTVSEFLKEMEG